MNRKRLYIIIAVVLVVALAISGSIYYFNSNNYVVKVGDKKISKEEYQFFLSLAENQVKTTLGITTLGETEMKTKVGNQTIEELIRETALDKAVEYKIELVKAGEQKIALSSEELKNLNANLDQFIESFGSALEADKQLKEQYGVDEKSFKSIYKQFSLTQKFRSEESKKITFSDEEIKAEYDSDPGKYGEVTIKHVLIKTIDDAGAALPEDKIKEAEAKANGILSQVNSGQDIGLLAKEYSEDPGSKDTGGEYTFKKDGQMVPEFENWAFEHKEGDTGVVKTSYGYHVMKLEKLNIPSFDEVKDSVKNEMVSSKFNEDYAKQMETWKKEAQFIVTKNEKKLSDIKI
ncbi:foldase protein PrsA [Anaerobacterium chartisolvens]|uniref:Foldase protein PrsA n=1 Tax=Anaerobacterium chartisolvens TaxID=1297424 RepID=A0A369BCW4_9FIRM|nr:peptidylprolyl isomerase [Anaerobacterium chartisolvens]RCX18426.1 foldase protein PrsA [Anaerobacterium chartisolvens]